ncbi:CRISPR system precrRNA processing endoribonuclease RAMP protein Cas6 [Lihuaxuella thermophila]|uniref:CRISPR-associated endoribonuclease Cas6 n=1 Tax=Lihuaxuella thermophila TaxID=1173111 RepID=A0A1H8E5W9_9BACL|nr:CRISPR system precrRNA processing endoribonuclease RAMP protein Cas6 [Lihuaxuella thermophila]SEN14843.1 CRISPR-associated endoribonuclease Cas6 [Lihuaxuella thermophila]
MFRLNLVVRSDSKFGGPGIITRRLHAYILKTIQQENPQLSQLIHDRKDRQLFSTCLSQDGITIHSPSKEVIQCLQQRFVFNDRIDLVDWSGTIQEIHSQFFSTDEVLKRFTNKFTFYFLTPATFYQYGHYYPLPEFNRLFSSAGKVLEMCENLVVSPAEIEDFARKVRVEHASISTKRVDFGKFKVIGFTGTLTINLKALPAHEQHLVWKLSVYGSMMGFGYKTAWGLGQTRLEPFAPILVSEHP